MTPPAQPPSPIAEVPADLAERAAALVNPASGLANDYLNIFNEIVMMIDLLPEMPDLAGHIGAWSPVTYRAYFRASTLAGRESALVAYEGLEPSFRKTFERCAADLSRAARAACATILDLVGRDDGGADSALIQSCAEQADRLRARLERMTDMVNDGPARERAGDQRRRRVASRSQRRSVGSSFGESAVLTRA